MKNKSLFSIKKTVIGAWVAIMEHERNDRFLQLSKYVTRCIRADEIHEFLICDKKSNLFEPINYLAYLGFGEIVDGGVIEVGDSFYNSNEFIGKIVGFDETHFPNHYNIIIQGEEVASGAARGFSLMDTFSIYKPPNL